MGKEGGSTNLIHIDPVKYGSYMQEEYGGDISKHDPEKTAQPTPEQLQKDGLGSLRFHNYPDG